MSSIEVINKYAPTKVACFGWSKRKQVKPLARKEQVKKNQKATWGNESMYSGDLLARMFEETDKQIETQRYPGQEDFKQVEKRMGKIIHSSEFIKKVLSLNRNLVYEDSLWNKGYGAFYLVRQGQKVYTAACFKLGWIPEWTIMKTDAADLPTRDGLTYGWRTPIQRLVQQKIITKAQVRSVFGTVERGGLMGRNWAIATGQFN
jgi:hypothetical protein